MQDRTRTEPARNPEDDMAIIGAHMLLYSSEPEALRDVFGWRHVDAAEGWLIFALPPAELGVHPADGPTYASGMRHQVTLMCDDIGATIGELKAKGIGVKDEPRHAMAIPEAKLRP